jgi:hypothetical protein
MGDLETANRSTRPHFVGILHTKKSFGHERCTHFHKLNLLQEIPKLAPLL